MNKLLLALTALLLISCIKTTDHTQVYRIIREKFPQDALIDRAIEKTLKPDPPLNLRFFQPRYDPLEFLKWKRIEWQQGYFLPQDPNLMSTYERQ